MGALILSFDASDVVSGFSVPESGTGGRMSSSDLLEQEMSIRIDATSNTALLIIPYVSEG